MGINQYVGILAIEMIDLDLQDAIIEFDKRMIDGIVKTKYRRQIMEAGCKREPLNVIKMFQSMEEAFSNKARVDKTIKVSNQARILTYTY